MFAIGRVDGVRTGTLPLEWQAYDRKSRDRLFREASLSLQSPVATEKSDKEYLSYKPWLLPTRFLQLPPMLIYNKAMRKQGNEESGDAPSGFILKLFQMVSGPDEIISVSSILLWRFRSPTVTIRIVVASMSIVFVKGFESRELF